MFSKKKKKKFEKLKNDFGKLTVYGIKLKHIPTSLVEWLLMKIKKNFTVVEGSFHDRNAPL